MFIIFITPFCLQRAILNDINLQHVSFHNKTSKVVKYNHKDSNVKLEGYVLSMDDAKIQ